MTQGLVDVVTYDTGVSGKTLAIFGAVHGNEPCGTIAINQLIEILDRGTIKLETGKLILVPVAHKEAYQAKLRHLGDNLNRYFFPVEQPQKAVDYLHNALCAILDECHGFLDIHSYHNTAAKSGDSLVFATGPKKEDVYYRSLGVDVLVTGWTEANGDEVEQDWRQPSTGSVQYARRNQHGCIAATMECGEHDDPHSVIVAEAAIQRAISFFGLVHQNNPFFIADYRQDPLIYKMQPNSTLFKVDALEKAQPSPHLRNFTHIEVGDDLLVDEISGRPLVKATESGYVLFPHFNAATGDELLSICQRKKVKLLQQ